jgi:hypothetical protein
MTLTTSFQQANEREIEMYLGGYSKEILRQIQALNVAQGFRLQSLDTKLAEAVARVGDFEVKAKAKLLRLGELQKPDRNYDWEHDTDAGETYVVKHGFEKGTCSFRGIQVLPLTST